MSKLVRLFGAIARSFVSSAVLHRYRYNEIVLNHRFVCVLDIVQEVYAYEA